MSYKERVKKYLEYCEFRKELDWNTLKAYLRQFFDYAQEDVLQIPVERYASSNIIGMSILI